MLRFAESWRMTVLDSWLRTEATITLLWRRGVRRFAASVSGARRNWRSYDEDQETIWNFLCDIVMCLTYDMQIICISTIYIYCLYYHIIIFHVLFVGISPSMLHCHRHFIDTKWILFGLHVKLKCDLNILSTPYL